MSGAWEPQAGFALGPGGQLQRLVRRVQDMVSEGAVRPARATLHLVLGLLVSSVSPFHGTVPWLRLSRWPWFVTGHGTGTW